MSRIRFAAAVVVIAASLGWVAARGLTTSLVYYETPTELLGRGDGTVGERVRVGGRVAPGSVDREGGSIRFIVTDGTTRLTVVYEAGVPALFRDGGGVVVEGVYAADGAFHADTILVRHADSYRPPEPGETPAYLPPGEG